MDQIQKRLLEEVADLHEVPQGAYSLRINGQLHGKNDSENITIVKKEDKPGIDIYIRPGTKNESMHIPVLLSQSGLKEVVYNDFHIGEDCDVTIVAGCGIHNGGSADSEHSGIHSFYLAKNAKLKYIEKHYGAGDGNGKNVMNPTTYVELAIRTQRQINIWILNIAAHIAIIVCAGDDLSSRAVTVQGDGNGVFLFSQHASHHRGGC